MKIAMISPAHPLRGGIAASSERLAQTLQDDGHEVVLYSFSLQYPDFLFPGKTQYTDDPPPDRLLIKTRINAINPVNWILVAFAITREKPDRIVVRFWLPFMGPCLGTILRLYRIFSRKKTQITALVDNIIPHEKRPGDRLLALYFARACHEFVVMSRSVATDISRFSKAPTRFAPHPVYDAYGEKIDKTKARRKLGLPADVHLVLFFGFIRKYKGLDLLLEALPMCPDVHCLIAGEPYEDWEWYQEIIDRRQLAGRVHLFNDYIPAADVALYFSASDLVVQPYRSATQSGISQIAYHYEIPMVVTRVGGLPEIVTDGQTGFVTDVDPAAIAEAINRYFREGREAVMAEAVGRAKSRFSWKFLADTVLNQAATV